MTFFRLILPLLIVLSSCQSKIQPANEGTEIVKIPLAGEINDPDAEISGLDWYHDQLILIPEDPQRFSDNNCYRVNKNDILQFLDDKNDAPIVPQKVKINIDYSDYISGIEGFEAIAFSNDTIFAVIEAKEGSGMKAWLTTGSINKEMSELNFDSEKIVNIPAPGHLKNFSIESIYVNGDFICCIYEANGRNVNHDPAVYIFNKNLDFLRTISFPNIEYRITDATKLRDGYLWVTNTYYTGEKSVLDIAAENLVPVTTNTPDRHVERIIGLRVFNDRVEISSPEAQMIKTIPEAVRNWEGLALLDNRGFLVINDKFPKKNGTILAFIKNQTQTDHEK